MDIETLCWNKAIDIFIKSEGREPDIDNSTRDVLAVSAIQLGYMAAYLEFNQCE